ncbi:MAG: restriction endonuclease subunit S [Bacteroidaceae bacterium]|nr:restriction endonuclease subunit S [Bacteroidaceae bacterium]
MKEGWEYKKLGEVCDFEGGAQPPKSEWINHPQDGYVRMLQIRDFTKSRNAEIEYVKITKKLRLCKADDILIGRYGASVGKILTGLAGAYNVAIIKSIPNEELIRKDFIRRYFESSLFQSILFKVCTARAAQAGFSKDDIKDELIPLPSLSEQQSIVDYLDSAFAKIDAMKANAEKALNEAKALFQASLKEMLEPKEGWEEKELGEVGTFVRGGNFSKKDFIEDGFPCVHYGQIHTTFGVATYKHLSCVPENMVKKERCASKGDLIIAITSEDDEGSCKSTAWMADYDAYVGGHTAIFKHNLNPLFVSYYFMSPRFQKAKLDYTHGFKVVEISPKDIAKISIFYPSLSEQQSIVSSLDTLKSKVDQLQANYDNISKECDALKQAILKQVFE